MGGVGPELGKAVAEEGMLAGSLGCCAVDIELNVSELISPGVENDGLELGPRVVLADKAVVAELKVEVEELLFAETPEIVTGIEDATCCD